MSYVTVVPYADEAYGIAYFADRLRTDAWDNSTSANRVKALKQATIAIDKLPFTGHKAVETWTVPGTPDQPRQFPRGDDTVVPDDVSQACCELALAFLDDVDPNLEVENLQNATVSLGGVNVNRIQDFSLEHVTYGIPSIQAWLLLKPYLRSRLILDIDRS